MATQTGKGGSEGNAGNAGGAKRRERLAAELRQNLKRRKSRDRAIQAAEGLQAAEPGEADAAPITKD